jgi:hypothetical protein
MGRRTLVALREPDPDLGGDLEDLAHQLLRDAVSVAGHRARVLVLDLGAPRLELAHRHQDPLEPTCTSTKSPGATSG